MYSWQKFPSALLLPWLGEAFSFHAIPLVNFLLLFLSYRAPVQKVLAHVYSSSVLCQAQVLPMKINGPFELDFV